MADVQLENGYTKIANELLEQLPFLKVNATQYKLILVIIRYTYGFNRKEYNMSLSFLNQATGSNTRNIQRELKSLEERNIIRQKVKPGSYRIIGLNKDYEAWVDKKTNGELTNGETTNGEPAKGTYGEMTNSTIGESTKGTYGEFANQEIKKENLKENFKENHHDKENDFNPHHEYQKYFINLPSTLNQELTYWIDSTESKFIEPKAILCEIIKRAAKQKPRNPASYIAQIIQNVHEAKCFTLEDLLNYNQQFDEKMTGRKNKGLSYKALTERPEGFFPEEKHLTEEERKEMKELEDIMPF